MVLEEYACVCACARARNSLVDGGLTFFFATTAQEEKDLDSYCLVFAIGKDEKPAKVPENSLCMFTKTSSVDSWASRGGTCLSKRHFAQIS